MREDEIPDICAAIMLCCMAVVFAAGIIGWIYTK